ncbi:DUF2242 domain-containing protein [Paraburkholderia sp. J63]|uniref:DUF2242 domain-containing protein n=1 Tax=Paraburkholderia sp. J63 TaxID=2805434 RepID=UPI002ABE0153|nr:DUF2242 domain-containing protein [Paraburkholderia sp. J63]
MPRFSRVAPFLLIPFAVGLSACSSTTPGFQDDQLLTSATSPFSHGFNYASTDACEASRRALLSQGYMTTMTHNDTVDATKNFQPTIDQHIVVEVHVVCTPADATNTSMVYVNAVQNGYALKKSATSASVGLSILGSVSLPIHSNSDEMVKVSSETIQSDAFYKRFFDLVGRYLNTVARSQPVPGSGDIKSTPLPLPPPLEPDPALMNTAAPGASAAPAAAAAATGVAVLHTTVAPATPVQGTQAAVPAAAASGVHAVFPASPASEATLLTPVLPAPAASAPAAAMSPASTPAAASAPAEANRAAQSGAAAAPASSATTTQAAAPAAGASATQAAAPASGAATTQAAAPASGAAAVQVAAQPAAASAAAPVTIAAAPASVANSGTGTSSPAPAGGTQNVAAASASGAANAPASNSAPAAAATH